MDINMSISRQSTTLLQSVSPSVSDSQTVAKRSQPEKELEKAAKEFESLFLNELMKSMRKANQALASDSDTSSMGDDVQVFQSMFDQQVAEDISKKGSLGIAESLIRQLSPNTESRVDRDQYTHSLQGMKKGKASLL